MDALNPHGRTARPRGSDGPIRSAGGVVWRLDRNLRREVLLVHRPRFDDWSLPKGKLKRGEHPVAAACREVLEETGVRPSVGARLPDARYRVRIEDGMVDKVVDYWAMRIVDDLGFSPGAEVDSVGWFALGDALDQLSYQHDRRVVAAFSDLPLLRSPVVLIRHASAGDRGSVSGPDSERSLDAAGLADASELVAVLICFAPRRLVSASLRRCVQTLEPLAAELSLPIDVDSIFDESADPAASAKRLEELGLAGGEVIGATIVCSQGGLIPLAIGSLVGAAEEFATPKGGGWVLSFAEGAKDLTVDRLA